MLTIRLQRTGTKNRPTFRLVLAESFRSASKRFIEILGNYNPVSKQFGIKSEERLKYWVGQNVKLSPTVHNLLVDKKFIDLPKVKAWKPKKKEAVEGEVAAAPSTVADVPAADVVAEAKAPEPVATETAAAPAPEAASETKPSETPPSPEAAA